MHVVCIVHAYKGSTALTPAHLCRHQKHGFQVLGLLATGSHSLSLCLTLPSHPPPPRHTNRTISWAGRTPLQTWVRRQRREQGIVTWKCNPPAPPRKTTGGLWAALLSIKGLWLVWQALGCACMPCSKRRPVQTPSLPLPSLCLHHHPRGGGGGGGGGLAVLEVVPLEGQLSLGFQELCGWVSRIKGTCVIDYAG